MLLKPSFQWTDCRSLESSRKTAQRCSLKSVIDSIIAYRGANDGNLQAHSGASFSTRLLNDSLQHLCVEWEAKPCVDLQCLISFCAMLTCPCDVVNVPGRWEESNVQHDRIRCHKNRFVLSLKRTRRFYWYVLALALNRRNLWKRGWFFKGFWMPFLYSIFPKNAEMLDRRLPTTWVKSRSWDKGLFCHGVLYGPMYRSKIQTWAAKIIRLLQSEFSRREGCELDSHRFGGWPSSYGWDLFAFSFFILSHRRCNWTI